MRRTLKPLFDRVRGVAGHMLADIIEIPEPGPEGSVGRAEASFFEQ